MADILLLEASYKNKYPPIGLMKISYFHKYIHKDYVRFSKGPLPEAFKDKKWDRVYVTTLFTFEWENTKKIIEYAYTVVKDLSQVYIGGILATLMPELIMEAFPNIILNEGLLNHKGTLGLNNEEEIDTLPLDYDILDDIDYIYPAHDAYFTYMTRGCGMKCQFCAVQVLEPNYIPYLTIKDNIKNFDKKFGPKKDLLLMDNNVLRSPCFDKIIDEIKELGFAKDAYYINPKTNKKVNRYIDFNQGLDAFLLTPHKAMRLGELALRPARIAFDHIEDKDAYVKAITLCAENGITHMSNYLLYNGDDFKGKGHSYLADTPEDLYNRMRISLDLCDELNSRLDHKVTIFSFPMRYIPLSDLKRGYVGCRWNKKYLRAVQIMLIPTQGKGVTSRSFFNADFGNSVSEFTEFLVMPEAILGLRGHFVEKAGEISEETNRRKSIWDENQLLIKEWLRLFRELGNEKDEFIKKISNNNFTIEQFETIESSIQQKLFIHYFSTSVLLKAINNEINNSKTIIQSYIMNGFPLVYKRLITHIAVSKFQYSLMEGLYLQHKQKFVLDLLNSVDILSLSSSYLIDNLEKVQIKTNYKLFSFSLLRYAQIFNNSNVFNKTQEIKIRSEIYNLNEDGVRKVLLKNINKFKQIVLKQSEGQVANDYLIREIEENIKRLYEQLTLL